MLKEYSNDQWQEDLSPYFYDGRGFWAKVQGATMKAQFMANEIGEAQIKIRVRTGSGTAASKATDLVSSYRVRFDGADVPMVLDTSKPNVPRPEYGGSHIGWIIGAVQVPDTKLHLFEFIANKQYNGIDSLKIFDAAIQIAYDKGYEAGLAAGSGGGHTDEELEQARAEGLQEGKEIQLAADKAALVLVE